MNQNDLTHEILDSAYKVHSALGPGLLESAYQTCLIHELNKKGLETIAEQPVPIVYDDIKLDCGYRLDILVENTVIIELKTVEAFTDVHTAQILTYLKFSIKHVGLLINFNVKSLKNGIRRFVL
ncbi:GxxExxY protein [Anaerophaga thermohalophila]|uniref:GxxExxY protein n=1 Tax=Anaerophaga thermohalophila TaxID=177400 RepID=UPI0002E6EE90|nr:GxxExxY protein [Anaerophaga thermohalophila]